MSAEATGWVWRFSPCVGSQLLVHLAIGDVVNDVHRNEFWMSTQTLARKARVSRSTVISTLADLVAGDLLEVVEAGGATRKASRYRFVFHRGYEAEGPVYGDGAPYRPDGPALARSAGPTSAISAPALDQSAGRTNNSIKNPNENKGTRPVTGLVDSSASDPPAPPPWLEEGLSYQEWALRNNTEGKTA